MQRSPVYLSATGTIQSDWGPARQVKTYTETTYCSCDSCEGHGETFDLPRNEWYWRYAGPIHMEHALHKLEDDRKALYDFVAKLPRLDHERR